MSETAAAPNVPDVPIDWGVDDARLEALGYRPQLNRVLGFFENFAVGVTYLPLLARFSSLFPRGAAPPAPAYFWFPFILLLGFFSAPLFLGESGSHYPVA